MIYAFNPFSNVKFYALPNFADDNFEFNENGGKLFEGVENTGKRRSCLLRALSPFPTVFSKRLILQTSKNNGLLGSGSVGKKILVTYTYFCSKCRPIYNFRGFL